MSKRGGVLLGSSEKSGGALGAKPPHPDRERWLVSLVGLLVVLVGFWGAGVAWWLIRLHPAVEAVVQTHLEPFRIVRQGFAYGAWGFLGLTGLGVIWSLAVWTRWRWRLRHVRGQYLTLVIPRPQHGRETASRTNPESPNALWDRLIGTLQESKARGVPPYLATELWGDSGGRVQWGVWLPDHLMPQREAIRRLMTAERPQARLVDASDPLLGALGGGSDDEADTGERWYADAVLVLRARDYFPLPHDELGQRSLVAALRPPRTVLASGVSVIVTPAPWTWARRVHQLVQRWRWISHYRRRFDERYKQETDAISLKAQQAHARVCLRVHVIAHTHGAAQAECRSLITTLMAGRMRYAWATQAWTTQRVRVRRVSGTGTLRALPLASRTRAPFCPLPRPIGVFPLM